MFGAIAMAREFHEPKSQRALTVAIHVVGKKWLLVFLPDPNTSSTNVLMRRAIMRMKSELDNRLFNIVPQEFPKQVAILFG